MKKVLKIGASILGVIILAVLILFVFFPGLPTYFYAKDKYEYINVTPKDYPHADVKTPENFVETTVFGLTLSIPPELEKKYPDETEGFKCGLYTDVSGESNTSIIFMENENSNKEFSLSDSIDDSSSKEKISVSKFNKAVEKLGLKAPENYYEFFNLVYTTSLDDFSIHKHGTSAAFLIIAEWKEMLYPSYIEVYPFETDNAIGFIQLFSLPSEERNSYKMIVELYSKNNLNHCFSAMVGSDNFTTVQQIVNSAKLLEE